ncbi:MAG: Tad domain-containing protein [Selenomonadaceae bacterium]|nr:Tad domain-containing protein [Selenomonadaceae bacterium]
MLKKFFKNKIQKGQSMVFFAIALPTLFMFVAAVIEFGWWFLNQSRLQNAADAAVLAGVNEILSEADANTVLSYDFVNKVPSGYSEIPIAKDAKGDTVALAYAEKNFTYVPFRNETNFFERHSYRNSKLSSATNSTAQNYFLYPMYYEVELRGQVQHLFSILNNFGEMSLHVKAIAKVSQSIIAPLEKLKVKNVITGNWEVQNRYQDINKTKVENGQTVWEYDTKRLEYQNSSGQETLFTGQWNHYKEPNKAIYYTSGDEFRRAPVDVLVTQKNLGTNQAYKAYGSAFATPANGGNQYEWQKVESINLDWAQDFGFDWRNKWDYSVADWDIGYKVPEDVTMLYKWNSKPKTDFTANTRVHGFINFYEAFPSIAKKVDKDGKENDNGNYYYSPLWARIESEPMWSYLGPTQRQSTLDTVHQIIISINESNWMEDDNNGCPIPITAPEKYHTDEQIIYRPIIFFYEGPETNADNLFLLQKEKNDGIPLDYNGLQRPTVRTQYRMSKPIILNLNADFCGVIYAPNSPVVIVHNGHKFKGFVVAKSYKTLKTSAEAGFIEIDHGKYTNKNMYNQRLKDSNGNIIPFKMYVKTEYNSEYGDDETIPENQRSVRGEVQFNDATAAEVEATLPTGSKYSIFNIEELKDTFFDPNNPYRPEDESVHILMTTNG